MNNTITDLKNNYVHITDIMNRWPAARGLPVIAISYNNDWDDYNSQLKTHVDCFVDDVYIDDVDIIKIKRYDEESMVEELMFNEDIDDEEEAYRRIDTLNWQPMIILEVSE